MAAVAAIANAPQNVIRKMAFPIGAPPSDADSPPKEAKKTKLRMETTHGIALIGVKKVAICGRTAQMANEAADAKAAWMGLAAVMSEIPSSSRA